MLSHFTNSKNHIEYILTSPFLPWVLDLSVLNQSSYSFTFMLKWLVLDSEF